MRDYLEELVVPAISCIVICFYVVVFATALQRVAGR